MSNIKLICLDMDGTLLLPYHVAVNRISPACIAALHAAQDAGLHLAIVSGRMTDDAGFFAMDAGIPGMHILGVNGTCCLDVPFGDVVENHLIPDATVRPLLRYLQENGIHYGVFSPFDLVLSDAHIPDEEIAHHWGTYLLRPGCRIRVHQGNEGIESALNAGVNKLLIRDDRGQSVLAPLREALTTRFPELEICSSWVNNLEINPRGIHKGSAVIHLAQRLGISLDEVMAIGDNDNDLPMLKVAGCAVAMGNSTPAVLDCAHYVTLSNQQDGVAAAIRALALGEQVEGVVKRT